IVTTPPRRPPERHYQASTEPVTGHPWFEEILPRLAAGLLVVAAGLGYRLKKSRPLAPGPDASSDR
ncbi:hypothetical protein RF640_17880, partial [Kocuria sp. CPCC 205231]|uniref:hypothetical protein n=1 Tax=Kocuria sp. CPCC 205231 TaxID=3073551 RepID=UPI0034D67595